MHLYQSLRDVVGRTPVLRLSRLSTELHADLYGKCEFMNPGGSIKDRIGFYMVEQAERRGELLSGGTLVEATAGNTGMGLAMAAAQRGYRLIAVMTTKMSIEKVSLLKSFGAKVVICPYEVPPESPQHFIATARRIAAETPGAWYVDQFANEDNVAAHYASTGPEIWSAMEGHIDALVAGIGTGGSLTGAGRFLREKDAKIRIVLADPIGSILRSAVEGTLSSAKPYLVEGIGGDFIPPIADLELVDETYAVSDAEAIQTAIDVFRSEGIFVGASSGTILSAALAYCRKPENEGKRVVALLPDGGRSYLSTIYNPEWRRKHQLAANKD